MLNKYLQIRYKIYFKKVLSSTFLFLNFLVISNTLLIDSIRSNEIQTDKKYSISKEKNRDKYILGPGDKVFILHKDIPEYSANYSIGPDGFIFLPEVYQIYAEGFTVNELKEILVSKYKKFIKNPDIFISVSQLRPVRVYLSGEVVRPGYYTISNYYNLESENIVLDNVSQLDLIKTSPSGKYSDYILPTIFDSIKAAKGLTTYSDLSNIEVIRKNTVSNGGGYLKTNLNFLAIINGDLSQNIRVFDGDKIIVKKTKQNSKDQLLKVINTNISPSLVPVFVSGKVANPGRIAVPQGSGLNQAIALAGGKNFLSGDIEFLRFKSNDKIDTRKFRSDMNAELSSFKNPILFPGDVINIKGSILGNTTEILNIMAAPVITSYTLYNLFND
tara:strand:- start:4884 stop:6044 length:1161 start_codon:yes stop_codon:yes gene_type:complete